MHAPYTRLSTALLAALGASSAAAQIDLTDQSTAPASVPLPVDLTIPDVEPMPIGGWYHLADDPVTRSADRHGAARGGGGAAAGGVASDLAVTSVRDIMTEPLVTEPGDGRIWIRSRDMRASFGREGLVTYPVFGRRSPQEWPVHFSVDTVTLGGEAIDSHVTGDPSFAGFDVTIPRAGLAEVYHLGLDAIEQTFVFDSLPGSGELSVHIDVETELAVDANGGALRFVHDEFGEVTYGEAFAVDSAGRKIAIERVWTGDGIDLTVPASFVSSAALPLTIDPPIITWVNSLGGPDDTSPDVTYAGNPGKYFVCWEEFTSLINADVYMTSVTTSGSQGAPIAVDVSNHSWDTPRVAYSPAGPRLLVVASRKDSFPNLGAGAITGQFVNPVTDTLVGAQFYVSSFGSPKFQPDVGGTNYTPSVNNHFLVTWSRPTSTTSSSIEYRVIDWTGSAITNVVQVAAEPNVMMREPAASESHGDATLSGDWWTIAWIRDTGTDLYGEVWARRVVWNGNANLGSGNFRVSSNVNCINPSVTSQFDDELLATGDRPSIVAYEKRFIITPTDSNTYARVVVDGHAYTENSFSIQREDFDWTLLQEEPNIATDGKVFVMSYTEDRYDNQGVGDFDMYMLSGHITENGNDAFLALAERHQGLPRSSATESLGRIAMMQDGNNQLIDDNGMCVYRRRVNAAGGQIRGSIFEPAALNSSNSGAVGLQYCYANANSVGTFGGRNKSWMWIRGTQSVTSGHVAHCVDMPLYSYGYLICSRSTANVNMPGGSQGRLCVGGSTGRYGNQLGFSGSNGVISTNIDPGALPQPTGDVAALPGETWYFQLWHRDAVGGQPTSNFSNGCSVYFLP